MSELISNDMQEAPAMSGEAVPYKDLENNEKMPENTIPDQSTQNNESNEEPKPKNKLVFYLSLIGGIFLFIILLLFILSIVLKIKNKNPTKENDETVKVEQKKESTISAVPKQITDKYKEIEKNLYDDNYDELDVAFPQIEWKIEFED